jgi:hypothetical protein
MSPGGGRIIHAAQRLGLALSLVGVVCYCSVSLSPKCDCLSDWMDLVPGQPRHTLASTHSPSVADRPVKTAELPPSRTHAWSPRWPLLCDAFVACFGFVNSHMHVRMYWFEFFAARAYFAGLSLSRSRYLALSYPVYTHRLICNGATGLPSPLPLPDAEPPQLEAELAELDTALQSSSKEHDAAAAALQGALRQAAFDRERPAAEQQEERGGAEVRRCVPLALSLCVGSGSALGLARALALSSPTHSPFNGHISPLPYRFCVNIFGHLMGVLVASSPLSLCLAVFLPPSVCTLKRSKQAT